MRTAARVVGVIVGLVFVYAGALKAMDPAAFSGDVASFHLLPHAGDVAVGLYLPWLEMICGAAMLSRRWAPAGRCVLAALLLVFLGAVVIACWRGLDVTCGCFGAAVNKTSYPGLIVRDAALLAGLWFSTLAADNRWLDRPTGPVPGGGVN